MLQGAGARARRPGGAEGDPARARRRSRRPGAGASRRSGRPSAAPRCRRRPCSTSPASTHNGDLLLTYPEQPELRILLPVEHLDGLAPGVGDRVLARLLPVTRAASRRGRSGSCRASRARSPASSSRRRDGLRIRSADRKARAEFQVAPSDLGGAAAGRSGAWPRSVPSRRLGLARAKVKERVGRPDDPAALTLMTAVALGLPMVFPPEALALADAARPVALGKREDLRDVPLVTIDGEDARDFDDAVWAEPDPRPRTIRAATGCWSRSPTSPTMSARTTRSTARRASAATRSISPTASSRCCRRRCPTTCARCGRTRTAPASRSGSTIDRKGEIRSWRFCRGLMRSRARLTYSQVQAAHDGQTDELTGPLLDAGDPAALRRLRAAARGAPPPRHDRARAAGAQDHVRRGRAADRRRGAPAARPATC